MATLKKLELVGAEIEEEEEEGEEEEKKKEKTKKKRHVFSYFTLFC